MPMTIIPHRQNMLRPHFPVNSIVQNDVLTQTALRLIGRNRNHHHIFHTIRLQQLIQNQYKEILAREKNNDKFIHLYDIGAYWVAFERSACRLSGLFSKSELTLFRVPDCVEYVVLHIIIHKIYIIRSFTSPLIKG